MNTRFSPAPSDRKNWRATVVVLVLLATALGAAALGVPALQRAVAPRADFSARHEGENGHGSAKHHQDAKDQIAGRDRVHEAVHDHLHKGRPEQPRAEDTHAEDVPHVHDANGEEHAHRHEPKGAEAADHEHVEAEAVKLSQTAQANVGLKLAKVELQPFERTISVPGVVVERPGRTNIQVAAMLTGMITKVWPLQGEAVVPGQPLFDLRLTHEEVVEAQAEFLKTAEELDVVEREINRLEKVTANGVVSGKTLLERKYERQKLQAAQRSQRQRLLLHGLSSRQVDNILAKRTLLSELTIVAPDQSDTSSTESKPVLLVQQLMVDKGQHVKAGDPLCVLADHTLLFIQGKAFEQDSAALDKALSQDWRVTAVIEGRDQSRQTVKNLSLLYVANRVEPESRAFFFYVQLPNKLTSNRTTAGGHRFSAWQFKPGQRVELLVPVERWDSRIVLPLTAVVQDGPESYVFEQNGDHFDRRSVRVEYRDPHAVVIANDGVLRPGKMVIVAGAYQVHLAMKNKESGTPDPHAGHNH